MELTRNNFRIAYLYFFPRTSAFQFMKVWKNWNTTEKLDLMKDYSRR